MSDVNYSPDDMHAPVAMGSCTDCGAMLLQRSGEPKRCDGCLAAAKPARTKKASDG